MLLQKLYPNNARFAKECGTWVYASPFASAIHVYHRSRPSSLLEKELPLSRDSFTFSLLCSDSFLGIGDGGRWRRQNVLPAVCLVMQHNIVGILPDVRAQRGKSHANGKQLENENLSRCFQRGLAIVTVMEG